ncbi:MAG: hypothetical protein II983_04085 [Firmicutes bacterium]|nr:hypothetical protein [Bacillota bacterium]
MDELERIDEQRREKEALKAEEEAKHLEAMGWYKGEDGKYYPKEETGVLEVKEDAAKGGYQKMVQTCGCGCKDE